MAYEHETFYDASWMDLFEGMHKGVLDWIVYVDESVPDITTRLDQPIISRPLIFSLVSIPPSHKPFDLETLVLQPSNAQKTSITKTALQRYDLGSWTVCVFKTLFHWWIQYEIPAKFSLGRSFKPNNYFPQIKYINLLAKSYMTTQYNKNN